VFVFFVSGRRTYGKVDEVDGAYVTTTFSHVWWLPFVPKGSWLGVEQASGGQLQDVAIGWSSKSVAAGYLRVWCPVLLAFGIALWSNRTDVGQEKPWALLIGSAIGLVASWTVLARVSPTAREQRRIYAEFAGCAVDVALLYGQRAAIRARLHAALRERFMFVAPSYRGDAGPDPDWFAIALGADATDAAFLQAAVTLARLDLGEAKGEARRDLARIHQAIWKKLVVSTAPAGDTRHEEAASNDSRSGTGHA
jgi:hypothetical protein